MINNYKEKKQNSIRILTQTKVKRMINNKIVNKMNLIILNLMKRLKIKMISLNPKSWFSTEKIVMKTMLN